MVGLINELIKVHLNGVFERILPVLEPPWPQRRVHESTMSDEGNQQGTRQTRLRRAQLASTRETPEYPGSGLSALRDCEAKL